MAYTLYEHPRSVPNIVLWKRNGMRRLCSAVFALTLLACSGPRGDGPQNMSLAVGTASTAEVSETALTESQIRNQTAQAVFYEGQAKSQVAGLPGWLQTVIGGLIALAGSVVTFLLTTLFAAKKTREEKQQTYERHRLQLRLATKDLLRSLRQFTAGVPKWVDEDLVYEEPFRPAMPARTDAYYLKYDLVDCIYRLCALLGWLELYRMDSSFLRGPLVSHQQRIEAVFGEIKDDLANDLASEKAKLNAGAWRDGFILEDDQRAIGEKMLDRARSEVIGYATFCEQLFSSPNREKPTDRKSERHQNWWIWNATRFIFEVKPKASIDDTFAIIRINRLADHCEQLLRELSLDVRDMGPPP